MIGLELMTEIAGRYGSGPGWAAVVSDACDQGNHRMDATDTVQDGMEWLVDHDDPEFCGLCRALCGFAYDHHPRLRPIPQHPDRRDDAMGGRRSGQCCRASRRSTQADARCKRPDARSDPRAPGADGRRGVLGKVLGDPVGVSQDDSREHPCCGALASGPHKMGCDYRLIDRKPCRCGPDGGSDSACAGRAP